MKVKGVLLGILVVSASLFLIAAVGIGVLVENKAFQATVSGRLTDTEGRPVPGASIQLHIAGTDSSENYFDCMTNAAGEYFLQTPTLRYALDSSAAYRGLSISAPGYVHVSVHKRVAKGVNKDWNFELTRAITVSGRLVDPEGNPMAGCSLLFSPEQKDTRSVTLRYHSVGGDTTGKDGRFRLDSVGPFCYQVSRKEYGRQVYRQIPVRGARIDLSEPTARQGLEICINNPLEYKISGHIKDAAGNPVKDAFVSVTNEICGAYVDELGAFSIIGLDGLGKDVFDITVEGKTLLGDKFETQIPDVRLHTDDLAIVVK